MLERHLGFLKHRAEGEGERQGVPVLLVQQGPVGQQAKAVTAAVVLSAQALVACHQLSVGARGKGAVVTQGHHAQNAVALGFGEQVGLQGLLQQPPCRVAGPAGRAHRGGQRAHVLQEVLGVYLHRFGVHRACGEHMQLVAKGRQLGFFEVSVCRGFSGRARTRR